LKVVRTSSKDIEFSPGQISPNVQPENMQLVWATKNHSASVVPLFAQGPGAEYFSDIDRNWQIGSLLKSLISSK